MAQQKARRSVPAGLSACFLRMPVCRQILFHRQQLASCIFSKRVLVCIPVHSGAASTYTHTVLRTSNVAAAICCALLAGTMRLAYAQEDDAAACAALKPREAAVAACTRRIESGQLQGADLALAHLNRARAHLPYPPRAELDKIGEDLNKAISLDRNNPEAYWTRASVFGWKQHEQGIADYAKVIALQPDRLDAYFEQAILLEYSDLDRAIANYSKMLELRPGWRAVCRRRARAYEMKGEDQLALADCDELIRMQPDEEPYSMRGFIHLRLRDDRNAAALTILET